MGMPVRETEWTADMALALPDDGQRYEVLDGELFVTPAPSWEHQSVVMAVVVRLQTYVHELVHEHHIGWLRTSPADITFPPVGWCSLMCLLCRGARKVNRGRGRTSRRCCSRSRCCPVDGAGRPPSQASDLSVATGAGVLDRQCGRAAHRALAAGRSSSRDLGRPHCVEAARRHAAAGHRPRLSVRGCDALSESSRCRRTALSGRRTDR